MAPEIDKSQNIETPHTIERPTKVERDDDKSTDININVNINISIKLGQSKRSVGSQSEDKKTTEATEKNSRIEAR